MNKNHPEFELYSTMSALFVILPPFLWLSWTQHQTGRPQLHHSYWAVWLGDLQRTLCRHTHPQTSPFCRTRKLHGLWMEWWRWSTSHAQKHAENKQSEQKVFNLSLQKLLWLWVYRDRWGGEGLKYVSIQIFRIGSPATKTLSTWRRIYQKCTAIWENVPSIHVNSREEFKKRVSRRDWSFHFWLIFLLQPFHK